ncbi:MAG: hypothetical protein ACYCST_16525 [Acidimicrobiales bacterium]
MVDIVRRRGRVLVSVDIVQVGCLLGDLRRFLTAAERRRGTDDQDASMMIVPGELGWRVRASAPVPGLSRASRQLPSWAVDGLNQSQRMLRLEVRRVVERHLC